MPEGRLETANEDCSVLSLGNRPSENSIFLHTGRLPVTTDATCTEQALGTTGQFGREAPNDISSLFGAPDRKSVV